MAVDPDFLLVIISDEIGSGPSDLGAKLTDLFFRNLVVADARPAKVLFLNSGIFLTTEGSPALPHLRALAEGGTTIVSCITCLTYHDRMGRIAVGEAGDMKGTVKDLTTFRKVVTL
ncbi:MAG: hypothetical protein MUE73_14440 [Planctomycetes bacterium]|jgi:tRNA 2-thiouridine synthesizing protein A|nr:hypothetical protein [Planctomycetota bacterium]